MAKLKQTLQIGVLAKASKTSVDTIRYYEKAGLISKPRRSDSGYRLYSKETVEKLLFIKQCQRLGLTLREIKRIIACRYTGYEPCCEMVAKLFTRKIGEFEAKIKELKAMKQRLNKLLALWNK